MGASEGLVGALTTGVAALTAVKADGVRPGARRTQLEDGGGARTHLLAEAARGAGLTGSAALCRREGAGWARVALEGSSLCLERPTLAFAAATCGLAAFVGIIVANGAVVGRS